MPEWLRGWLDLVLPPACAGCRRSLPEPGVLCAPCAARLVPAGPVTPTPRHLDACVAAVDFAGAAEDWIHRFKYPPPGLAGLDAAPIAVAAELSRSAAERAPWPPDLVIPIPLHPRRLRARGFNPALHLARAAARACGARLAPAALRRVRDTESQTGLTRSARARNVRGAFAARAALHGRIWLVDDVVTTGATLSDAARALRAAGAHHVLALCAARTP